VTYTTAAKNEAKTSSIELAEAVAKLRDSMITKPLSDQVASHPGLAKTDTVYLSGGIVWTMASLLHPDEPQEEYLAVTAKDIDTFHQLLTKSPGSVPMPDLAKIRDEGTRKLAESEIQRAKDTFTPDQMLAGSEVLKAVSDVMKFGGKKVYFSRYGYIAWISAYARSGGQPDKIKIGESSGARPDLKTKPDSKTKPDADTKSKPDKDPKAKPGSDTDPKTKPGSDSDPKTKPGTDPTPKVKPVALGSGWNSPSLPPWVTHAAAVIAVQVPVGARVYVDDYLTRQDGAMRFYVTPPLPVGGEYTYQFKVEVVRNGKPVTGTRQVSVQAGFRTDVDLMEIATQATESQAQAPRQ
jgi:uncharacterized protein (TIGR03000 family)